MSYMSVKAEAPKFFSFSIMSLSVHAGFFVCSIWSYGGVNISVIFAKHRKSNMGS